MSRRGTATLPLHDGSAPRWLFDRMVDLGEAVAELVVREYGQDELVRRLADPYWFQALGCALGFDWHSSGVTTTTMGALKEALDPVTHGVAVVGGKGRVSRRTPDELADVASRLGLGAGTRRDLVETSKRSATVDNACLQDAYALYHHTMAVTERGDWAVVQQGMHDSEARRYHWLSEAVDELVVEPQNAICSRNRGASVLDLTASASGAVRDVSVDLVQDDPARLKRYLGGTGQTSLADFRGAGPDARDARGGGSGPRGAAPTAPSGAGDRHLRMPSHHELRPADLSERAIDQLANAYEYQPDDYEELISVEGVGPKSLRALALIAELVYDAESSREDPAKYAYAHGGKDGTPHPIDRERYDRSVEHLREVLRGAEVDGEEKQASLARLAELEGGSG